MSAVAFMITQRLGLLASAVAITVTAWSAPSFASTFSLTPPFSGGYNYGNGTSYSTVYLNDGNGTLSFGDAYNFSGPNVGAFLAPPATVTGIIAPGFGDYSSGGWSTPIVGVNNVTFNFSGVDTVTGLTNSFGVTFTSSSTLQFNWTTMNAPNSVLVGLYAVGTETQEADPTQANFGLAPNNSFFYYDFSLPGAAPISVLNAQTSPNLLVGIPEPSSLLGLVLLGVGGGAVGLGRKTKK